MRWLLLLALSFVLCMAEDEFPCTIHHEGRYYDLNPLKSNQDYEFRTPGGNLFTINVCRRPLKESFGLKDVDDSTVAGFVRLDHGDFSIGTVNTTLSTFDSNIRLTLTGGSRCKLKSDDTELRGSTIVDFVCDTSVFGTGQPRLVAQFPPGGDEEACGYLLQWKTHVACPTHEPGRAWGFLAFLIFTLIGLALLYLIAGTLYNHYVLRLQGFDQIPRFSLLSMRYHVSEVADWFKDLTGIGSNKYNYRMPEEGLHTPFSGGNVFPRSAQSTGLNPVSHHTQVSSSPSVESAGRGSGGGAFVRPYTSRTSSASGNKPEINPISHQAQTSVTASAAPPPPMSDPSQPQSQSQSQQAESPSHAAASSINIEPEPAKEKHRPPPFDLGDDDDDEANSGSAMIPSRQAGAAAQERGRNLGNDGVIRL
ncbi:Putative mannose 6-phosphate receptor-like protein [Termitomyces sp. J132]|nr:Putative mannose 6-phosphate receptor-like protein [Termitomyces sp. J132]